MNTQAFHLHLVSDSTGETINSIVRACLVQFEGLNVERHFWSLVRSTKQLDVVMDGISKWPGMVLYTFMDESLRKKLMVYCTKNNIRCVSVLDPVMDALSFFFGKPSSRNPGRQHVLDASYFSRIDAVNFALATDDGNRLDLIEDADVLVIGVSRTSKTPTCVYLANQGIKASNIPFVAELPFPVDISKLKNFFVVGLTIDPESLVETRQNRLKTMIPDHKTSRYIDKDAVIHETRQARRLFSQIGCPVIDVTRRSVEETASEIMMLLNKDNRVKITKP